MSHPPDHTPDALPGGQGVEPSPSRSDLDLWRQALRNDWAIPPVVKRRLLQAAVNLADPSEEEAIPSLGGAVQSGEGYTLGQRVRLASVRDRTKLGALRVVAQFAMLNARQAAIDLAREKFAAERPAAAADDEPRRILIPGADDRGGT